MPSNVKHVQFTDNLDPRVMLRQIADDDKLKGAIVVSLGDDGEMYISISNLSNGDVAWAILQVQQLILDES